MTTSRFDDSRTVEFFGGVWDGQQYTPRTGEDYPAELHMPHRGRAYWYRLSIVDGKWAYRHTGTLIPDGADIW